MLGALEYRDQHEYAGPNATVTSSLWSSFVSHEMVQFSKVRRVKISLSPQCISLFVWCSISQEEVVPHRCVVSVSSYDAKLFGRGVVTFDDVYHF